MLVLADRPEQAFSSLLVGEELAGEKLRLMDALNREKLTVLILTMWKAP